MIKYRFEKLQLAKELLKMLNPEFYKNMLRGSVLLGIEVFHPAYGTHRRGFIGRQQPTRASQRVWTVVGAADVGLIDHQSLAHRFYAKKPFKLVVQQCNMHPFHYFAKQPGLIWMAVALQVDAPSGHFLHCCSSLFARVTLPMVTPAGGRMWHLNLLQ